MKIHTALILCAGFGKRLNPLTINTPKPLLIIKNLTLLDHCINLIVKLNIKKVLINSFYLKEQINEFVRNHNYNIEIKAIEDGENILDTGGGILNLIDKSEDDNFLIFNPDTICNPRLCIYQSANSNDKNNVGICHSGLIESFAKSTPNAKF